MSHRVKQRQPKGASSTTSQSSKVITDPRFANIHTDPRFRLPSRKHNRVQLDKRFARVLEDDEFSKKAQVDKYGRRLPSSAGKRELKRLYHLDDPETREAPADEDVEKELKRVGGLAYDPARQGGFDTSSSSEGSSGSESEAEDEDAPLQESVGEVGVGGRLRDLDIPMGEVSSRLAAVNMDWDNIRAVDLMAVAQSFCPSGGRVKKVSVFTSEFGRERMEREETQGPAPELFAKRKSNGTPNVAPQDLASSDDSEESDNIEDDDDDVNDEQLKAKIISNSTNPTEEVDSHALRNYQLSRLKYYYAVIACDSADTAYALYNGMDGSEYLSTANFFDLRFVPESVTFNDPITDKPRDQCEKVPDGYRPNDFVTEALTHSNVKLTWDEDDKTRKELQKRAFSREEVDENDLQAYVGSESSSSDDEAAAVADRHSDSDTTTNSKKKAKAEEQRRKMRAALGLSVESAPKKSKSAAPTGGMQITFAAGLSAPEANANGETKKSSVFLNKPSDAIEETTVAKYVRKEKERKAKRKAKSKSGQTDTGGAGQVDAEDTSDHGHSLNGPRKDVVDPVEEDPFADAFFTDPASANSTARREAKREKKRRNEAEATVEAARKKNERRELELLVGEDEAANEGSEHFDMAAIRQREKDAKKKGKRKHKVKKVNDDDDGGAPEAQQDNFELNVDDPRFKGVFDNHEFAIDPSNPRFSGTEGMKQLLEAGRRKRKKRDDGDVEPDRPRKHASKRRR
ncbi:MAG: pre-rRNA-processing protein esf1 [Chrysothrix sp. TS-e1954]|nr:MAG: pre-rRNA-processing protein esf1 [Chrysothrix sp. TS-e1954]